MSRVIESYIIKRSESSQHLAEYVQEAIDQEGYQPFGVVFNMGCNICQPMVKYKERTVDGGFTGAVS